MSDPIEQMAERVAEELCLTDDHPFHQASRLIIRLTLNALSPQDAAELAVEKGGMVHVADLSPFGRPIEIGCWPGFRESATPLYRKADGRRTE